MSRTIRRILMVGPLVIFAGGLVVAGVQVPVFLPVLGIVVAFSGWAVWAGTSFLDGKWNEQ